MYEARCRRCFEPQLAHEKIQQQIEDRIEDRIEDQKAKNSDPSSAHAATN
jgi:hypothetical protein